MMNETAKFCAFPESCCRHVAENDNSFTAQMRFHQSWYRHHILKMPPGPNPNADGELYGNMLNLADGKKGSNFLFPEIHQFAEKRLAEGVGNIQPHRLRNNLLSSQPMAFNLFAPLAMDIGSATRLVSSLLGVPGGFAVTKVRLEYAPPPRKAHLNDSTSFDVLIEYKRDKAVSGFIGVETKLTEPFSRKEYKFDQRYSYWMQNPHWWWKKGSEQQFSDTQFNQLWRNQLLAFSMLHKSSTEYGEGYCAVLYHPGDTDCASAIEAYNPLLNEAGKTKLLIWTLDDVIRRWRMAGLSQKECSWIDSFFLRYLDLQKSEKAWSNFKRIRQ